VGTTIGHRWSGGGKRWQQRHGEGRGGRRLTGATPEMSDVGRSRGACEPEAVHNEELGLGLIKRFD
jgi:hypothetical protein